MSTKLKSVGKRGFIYNKTPLSTPRLVTKGRKANKTQLIKAQKATEEHPPCHPDT
jgi:hypothetical protein